jgi:hypothetical protein
VKKCNVCNFKSVILCKLKNKLLSSEMQKTFPNRRKLWGPTELQCFEHVSFEMYIKPASLSTHDEWAFMYSHEFEIRKEVCMNDVNFGNSSR